MPGLDFYFYRTPESRATTTTTTVPATPIRESNHAIVTATPSPEVPSRAGAYYNPRLDPKNFMEGPLSWDPATRLRQMLARPGIVVRSNISFAVSEV